MSDTEKEQLAKEIAEMVIEQMFARRQCPCGLQEKRMQEHDEHHIFIAEAIDFLRSAKKSVLQTVIVTIIGAILAVIWMGFQIKVKG